MKKQIKQMLPARTVRDVAAFLFPLRQARVRTVHRLFRLLGYNVSKRHDYYSTLPVLSDIALTEHRWAKPSELPGVRFDVDRMRDLLLELHRKWQRDYETRAGIYDQNLGKGFGPGYPEFDARTLFYMLREIKPRRYLEVGSGLSTYYTTRAAEANREDGHPMQINCIEPFPYQALHDVPDITITKDVAQNIPLPVFESLQSGDVLFINSSHALKIDSDVAYLFLEVLPGSRRGFTFTSMTCLSPITFPFRQALGYLAKGGPSTGTKRWWFRPFSRSTQPSRFFSRHRLSAIVTRIFSQPIFPAIAVWPRIRIRSHRFGSNGSCRDDAYVFLESLCFVAGATAPDARKSL